MNSVIAMVSILISMAPTNSYLSVAQQSAVLQEAWMDYAQGIAMQASDPVASQQSFKSASNRYKLLVSDGIENGELWYNLGNAYLQSGEIGEAIAAYKSAQRFIPLDPRLRTNLAYARSLVHDPIEERGGATILQRLTFWHHTIPMQIRLYLALGCWMSLFALLSYRLFRVLPAWKTGAISTGVAALLIGSSVYVDMQDQHRHLGVLIAQDVIVRSGHGENHAPIFQTPLSEGIEFELVGERADWLQIQLPDGKIGWIQKQDAQIVSLQGDRLDHLAL